MCAMERPWTYRDLQDLPDDGVLHEIIGGVIAENRSFPRSHQEVISNVFWLLQRFLRQSKAGSAYPPRVDVVLSLYDIVQPDIVVIRRDRLDIYTPEGIVEGPPDLVVEVTSPSTFRIDHVRKMALYARTGVSEYWIANPDRRTFSMYLLQDGIYSAMEAGAHGLMSSVTFPGLQIDPKGPFLGLDG